MNKLSYPEELALAAVEWNRLRKIEDSLRSERAEVEGKWRDAQEAATRAYQALFDLAQKAEVQLV